MIMARVRKTSLRWPLTQRSSSVPVGHTWADAMVSTSLKATVQSMLYCCQSNPGYCTYMQECQMQYLTVHCLTERQLLSWLLAQPLAARLRSLLQTPYVWPLPPRRPRKSKVSQDTYTNIVRLFP